VSGKLVSITRRLKNEKDLLAISKESTGVITKEVPSSNNRSLRI
jgi:hypothetical protein